MIAFLIRLAVNAVTLLVIMGLSDQTIVFHGTQPRLAQAQRPKLALPKNWVLPFY